MVYVLKRLLAPAWRVVPISRQKRGRQAYRGTCARITTGIPSPPPETKFAACLLLDAHSFPLLHLLPCLKRGVGEEEMAAGCSHSSCCRSRKEMGGLLPLALLAVLSAAAAAPQLVGAARAGHSLPIIQEDIIRTVNNHPNAGWTAGHNPYLANYTIEQFKHILGVKPTPPGLLAGVPTKTYSRSEKEELPKEFDARSKWSGCSTIGKILDQGHCGACWAFGAVECLQDRFCIHHGVNVSLSVNDLVACCGFLCGDGCDGGYPIFAWQYFVENGVVTDECDPFFDQIGCQHPGCEPAYPTPVCEKKCKVQNQVWEEKKHFSIDAYQVNSDPHDIMAEVYKNGPVEVSFIIYEDFAHYKSGVYKQITGKMVGGHAAKLIGWGTSDAGEDYWLLANQWNRGWGEDGYFKVIRGTNECGIEGDVNAGMPSTKNIAGGAFAI